jgi:lipopolysaccharide kinase (Kdo/WaaP) family protein
VVPAIKFASRSDGRWKMLVDPKIWDEKLWEEIRRHIAAAKPAEHPQTVRLALPGGDQGYLKLYGAPAGAGCIKDLFRDSKAFRALKQSDLLANLGFHVPPPLAAGEERSAWSLGRAFLLTREIAAKPLTAELRERFAAVEERARVREKRKWLASLAREIQRLHRNGFVHGDLVASNILVAAGDGDPVFYFMDHDRTRRYSAWMRQRLWRRNLIQLNRFALPGVSLRDRLRFMRAYGEDQNHELNEWIEAETRRRYGAKRKLLQTGREFG